MLVFFEDAAFIFPTADVFLVVVGESKNFLMSISSPLRQKVWKHIYMMEDGRNLLKIPFALKKLTQPSWFKVPGQVIFPGFKGIYREFKSILTSFCSKLANFQE